MYDTIYHHTDLNRFCFLVTGGAGFIGSNLVEYLLMHGARKVRVLDNFSTGFHHNIDRFKNDPAFEWIEGDIRDLSVCRQAMQGMDYVSHQAALGSVPRSINDPVTTNDVNISGFLNMLWAQKGNVNIKRLVYAASSSVYGDSEELPKTEEKTGKLLSPYAVTKYVNELYADVFAKTYGIETIGLRYFNVFGPKQSSQGAYAAVIPLFIKAIKEDGRIHINGDGTQTRDFTFIENAVQANIRAFFVEDKNAVNQVYNIGCGERASLNRLIDIIGDIEHKNVEVVYGEKRMGDISDSLADIQKAKQLLGYEPLFSVGEGLQITYRSF